MIHFLLRLGVWVVVLGGAYLLMGPDIFDSSGGTGSFGSAETLYLPPAKSQRQSELERLMQQRPLGEAEATEYRRLAKERDSRFWQQQGTSVEQALLGVETQRRRHLVGLLEQRGATQQEISVFLLLLERDHPALLADRK